MTLNSKQITTKYKQIAKAPHHKFVFVGEHNAENEPDGLCKYITERGHIVIANINRRVEKNGWAISFIGEKNQISLGHYKDNTR